MGGLTEWLESKMMNGFGAVMGLIIVIIFLITFVTYIAGWPGPLEWFGFAKIDDSCNKLYNLATRKIDCRSCNLSVTGDCNSMGRSQCFVSPKCVWRNNKCLKKNGNGNGNGNGNSNSNGNGNGNSNSNGNGNGNSNGN